MEKRNLTPLRNVLVRYLVVCGGGSIVILLVPCDSSDRFSR